MFHQFTLSRHSKTGGEILIIYHVEWNYLLNDSNLVPNVFRATDLTSAALLKLARKANHKKRSLTKVFFISCSSMRMLLSFCRNQ